jgi:soluble lytic murein transglycosylase-like protein
MRINKQAFSKVKFFVIFKTVAVVITALSIMALHERATSPTAGAGVVYAATPALMIPTSGNADIDKWIVESSSKHGVDPKLVYYVIRQESNFKTTARSHKDAQGLMQMIPATAERFKVEDPYDPQQNIEGGVRYLRWLLKEFKGDVKLALAGYNAGEGAVKKCGNQVPDYKETQNYVQKITKAYGKTFHPVLTPAQARETFAAAMPVAE